jgi:phosphatidylglycerol:prolipoprotein diacylglycerol transferase
MRQIIIDFGTLDIFGHEVALRIFGYGLMLVLGFVTAIILAQWRARRAGESPEIVSQCGMVALVGGVLGARLAYVIENWSDFANSPNLLGAMLDITSGGLIYYGGLILAAVGVVVLLLVRRQPLRRHLDIVAASLMIGLAFGRAGCFLNGCCYGARCEAEWALSQEFPMYSPPLIKLDGEDTQFSRGTESPSPPYSHQLHHRQITPDGRLLMLGTRVPHPPRDLHGPLSQDQLEVMFSSPVEARALFDAEAGLDERIDRGEWDKAMAADGGLLRGSEMWSEAMLYDRSGDRMLSFAELWDYFAARRVMILERFGEEGADELEPGQYAAANDWLGADLVALAAAQHAHAVKPAQLLGLINALLIAGLLMVFYRLRTREGQVMALLMILYPAGRFMLELIRDDNPHNLASGVLTHNQWTSLLTLAAGIALMVLLHFLPPSAGPALAQRTTAKQQRSPRRAKPTIKRS